MTQEKTIKYFDIVIKNIENVTFFSPNDILHDYGNLKWETDEDKKEFNDILVSLISFGKTYSYLDKKGSGSWYFLTPQGIDLKNYKKGHLKFQSKSPPLTKYQKIYLPLFILFGLFGIYKTFQSQSLKTDIEKITIERDSLNIQNNKKDLKIDSLKQRLIKAQQLKNK